MPHPDYLETPRTDADASSLANGLGGLDRISPEKSFMSPSKGRELFRGMKNGGGGGLNLKTPRVGERDALRLLPNGVGPNPEFTPMLKSATKKNHAQRASARKFGAKSPYLPKDVSILNTPGLPRVADSSNIYDDKTSSSAGRAADETLQPQIVDGSSAQSTPLAQLPPRNGNGGVIGDGNMMTLREQENMIGRIEKDNFGLKIKIHFLEEAMARRGTEFNQAALKENTDLKVDRVTMQRELHRLKKNIAQAERDAELYKLQLAEYRERIKREQTDETVRIETERLQDEVRTKETEVAESRHRVQQLERKLDNMQTRLEKEKEEAEMHMKQEIANLESQLEDAQDERERLHKQLTEKDDEDGLDSVERDRLRDELNTKRCEVDRLQDQVQQLEDEVEVLQTSAEEARGEAEQHREEEVDSLEEQLRDVKNQRDRLQEQLIEREEGDGTEPARMVRLQDEVRTKQSKIFELQQSLQELEEEVEVLQIHGDQQEETSRQVKADMDRMEGELRGVKDEKQSLQDKLGNVNIQLHEVKNMAADVGAERDELQSRLSKVEKAAEDTFSIDHENRKLQRSNQRLEMEMERLREERNTLQQDNVVLRRETDGEVERANAEEGRLQLELDTLRNRQLTASDNRDRELNSAKNNVQRLEMRTRELEGIVAYQSKDMPSPGAGAASALRDELAEARRKEAESLKREASSKSTTRDLRSKVVSLEREMHEVQMSQLNTESKSPNPSPSSATELKRTRNDLLEAQTTVRDLRVRNQELEDQASTARVDEAERADLHELVKSSTLEAESLSLKLSERDTKLNDLRGQVKRLRLDGEKAQGQKVAVGEQLSALQERHRKSLTKLRLLQKQEQREEEEEEEGGGENRSGGTTVVRQKEVRGLSKEVVWLRARCRREEEFRRDLAWSKGFMEMGEGLRAACTQAELRMIQEMGVEAPAVRSSHEARSAARQRLRAAVYVVVAANRMVGLERQWRGLKVLGEGLCRKRREGVKVGKAGVRAR